MQNVVLEFQSYKRIFPMFVSRVTVKIGRKERIMNSDKFSEYSKSRLQKRSSLDKISFSTFETRPANGYQIIMV